MARTATARPPVREADIRTEPEREPIRAKQRTRKGVGTNQMHIPASVIPDGIDLQWNSETIVGAPAQHESIQMAQQGWEPVTTGMFDGRFDYLMPKGYQGQIVYGAARLDWRPLELTLEARGEELGAARQARNVEDRKIASGQVDGIDPRFMNTDHAKAKANTFLRKEMGHSAIPE